MKNVAIIIDIKTNKFIKFCGFVINFCECESKIIDEWKILWKCTKNILSSNSPYQKTNESINILIKFFFDDLRGFSYYYCPSFDDTFDFKPWKIE